MHPNLFNTNTYAGFNTTININSPTINVPATSVTTAETQEQSNNPSKIYGENWIVMQNRMVHAISNLELDERRLVLHLSPIVRKRVDQDPTAKRFIVNANEFAKEFGLKGNHYYDLVRKAALSLQDKSFWTWEFERNEKARYEARVSWIGKSVYKPRSAIVEIILMDDVIEMLSVFDRNNPFTKYHKDLIVNLNSDGLILLELVASFEGKRHKQQTFTTEYIREKFNRVDTYPSISEFKRNVLDKAVADLKKFTPYVVSYDTECNRGGRAITHFTFSVHRDKESINVSKALEVANNKPKKVFSKGLTDKQIAKLAKNKKQFVSANQHMNPDKGLDFYQIFENFKPLLADKSTVNSFHLVDELLSIKVGETFEAPAAQKPAPKKPKTVVANASFAPTAAQIKLIAANPEFQNDYPNTSYATGSDSHIAYLEFRLGSNATEFTKRPLSTYLK